MKLKIDSKPPLKIFIHAFLGGIGWAAGASFGFAILIALITYILNLLGGLPLIGQFVGQIVKQTQVYLNSSSL